MVPREWIQPIKNVLRIMRAHIHCDVFQARLSWHGIVKFYKGSIFCHHGESETQFAIQSQVT